MRFTNLPGNKIAIIGGGISGLAVLHYLKASCPEHAITLYEANSKVGGLINTWDDQGFFFETGPNAFLTNQPNTLDFIRDVGFDDQIIEANTASQRRYVQIDGKLQQFPMNFGAFIQTPLLSTKEKFRLLQGLFQKNISKDQSIYDYMSKRFGTAVAERFIDPFLSGVSAGDIKRLHMQWAFPKLGSKKGGQAKLCSFKRGMGSLIQHLFKKYEANIKLGMVVNDLQQIDSDIRILCTPAYVSSKLLNLEVLNQIPYSPIAVIGLLFKKNSFKNQPNGFGYLIPSTQKKEILGVLLETNVFNRSSSPDETVIRVMVGGAHNPQITANSDGTLVEKAIQELDLTYGLKERPKGISFKIWPKAIPQYELTYPYIRKTIQDFLEHHPNIHLCANYLDGISFNDCIFNAKAVAARALAHST